MNFEEFEEENRKSDIVSFQNYDPDFQKKLKADVFSDLQGYLDNAEASFDADQAKGVISEMVDDDAEDVRFRFNESTQLWESLMIEIEHKANAEARLNQRLTELCHNAPEALKALSNVDSSNHKLMDELSEFLQSELAKGDSPIIEALRSVA
jgi:hypothetical protein